MCLRVGLQRFLRLDLELATHGGLADRVPERGAARERDFEEELGPTLIQAQNAGRAQIDLYPMAFVAPGSSARAANAMACATEAGFGQRYYHGLFANPTLEWNDGQLLDLAEEVTGARDDAFSTCVHDLAAALGGSFSAEHGVGILKVGELARYESPTALALMRTLKAAVDPHGIMNPGKLL